MRPCVCVCQSPTLCLLSECPLHKKRLWSHSVFRKQLLLWFLFCWNHGFPSEVFISSQSHCDASLWENDKSTWCLLHCFNETLQPTVLRGNPLQLTVCSVFNWTLITSVVEAWSCDQVNRGEGSSNRHIFTWNSRISSNYNKVLLKHDASRIRWCESSPASFYVSLLVFLCFLLLSSVFWMAKTGPLAPRCLLSVPHFHTLQSALGWFATEWKRLGWEAASPRPRPWFSRPWSSPG